jgi:hypothetical protein
VTPVSEPKIGAANQGIAFSSTQPMDPSSSPSNQAAAAVITGSGMRATVDIQDPPKRRGLVIGSVALGGLAFVTLIGLSVHNLTKAQTPPTATTETHAAEKATVIVSVSPASAKIFVDDLPVPSNPGQMVIARDGNTHRIRAEAQGYESKDQVVIATLPAISVNLSLERAAEKPAASPTTPPAPQPPPQMPIVKGGPPAPHVPPPVNTGAKTTGATGPTTAPPTPTAPPTTTASASRVYNDPWK